MLPMITEELWDRLGIPDGWDTYFKLHKQNLVATAVNGSKIYFRSCDRPEDLRGPNLGWFFVDEAAKVSEHVWKLMVARLRRPPERGWLTTTPKGRNWIWDEFAKRTRRNYEHFTGATSENKFLSADYIASLKESYSGAFLQQEFYGEFVAWSGLVYPNVNVETHHLDAPEGLGDYKYALSGTDWGWADPSVVLVGLVGTDGLIHLVDEFYRPRAHIESVVEIAESYADYWKVRTYHCDPSRPEYIQKFREAGLDARKAKNEIDPGIAELSRLIDAGLFRMDFNRCPETAREFEVYHYAEDDHGKVLKDRPVDKDNHCMDALRYLVYSNAKSGHSSSRRGFR